MRAMKFIAEHYLDCARHRNDSDSGPSLYGVIREGIAGAHSSPAVGSQPIVPRPPAALRNDPFDILIGVFDVARFAMHAISSVDLQMAVRARAVPFVDGGGAEVLAGVA